MQNFEELFDCLTGNSPFPWQRKLYEEFVKKTFRKTCPIPTGLGKTSIIPIWLLALAHHIRNGTVSGFPRRLVYVVNRRTVVDQATDEAQKMRESLVANLKLRDIACALQSLQTQTSDAPLAISTLRGQFADNGEWRNDPARPAVIIGTVDMIGSRLLFSGYGCGFKTRPLHAGFLGQDTLLVHDEAHLEPAFQNLIEVITAEQLRCHEFKGLQVMELTATSRSDTCSDEPLFSEDDKNHAEVQQRINAKKGITFITVDDKKLVAEKVLHLAKDHNGSGQAILIFLRYLEDVKKVVAALGKVTPDCVEVLTGTLRGWERDELTKKSPVFARFMRVQETSPREGTVFLVCTSAGEVGINISADHLICDLTPFDSMMQRFGRVNRFGAGDAHIDIVHCALVSNAKAEKTEIMTSVDEEQVASVSDKSVEAPPGAPSKKKDKQLTAFDLACEKTLTLLHQKLPIRDDQRRNASPSALSEIPAIKRQAAFTPPPEILPVNEILFDAWALTTIRQKLPGRPPVTDWLHGVGGWEPPVTHVAWREEVGLITGDLLEQYLPADLLEDYPLKSHELLRDQEYRVRNELEKISARHPDMPTWLVDTEGSFRVLTLANLVNKDKQKKYLINIADCTVLLPPEAGGLENGLLNGDASNAVTDIADLWLNENGDPRRKRVWDDMKPKGMRLVRIIDRVNNVDAEQDEDEETHGKRYWRWFVRPRSADDDGSRTAPVKQELITHCQSAESFAKKLVAGLELRQPESTAVVLAARWHDLGKDRQIWQRSIGNHDYQQQTLAKSGPGMRPLALSNYRHEFGSLIDVSGLSEFLDLQADVQDLVLHLIAAHHGRSRPHFPGHEAFDNDRPEDVAAGIARESPRRFARLQRKYGRWGLAYIESLVRAADVMASQAINESDTDNDTDTRKNGGAQ